MRRSEFNLAMATEYGAAYAAVVLNDLVLPTLANRTGEQALSDGVRPRDVWLAIVAETDVPRERWHGVGLPKPA